MRGLPALVLPERGAPPLASQCAAALHCIIRVHHTNSSWAAVMTNMFTQVTQSWVIILSQLLARLRDGGVPPCMSVDGS